MEITKEKEPLVFSQHKNPEIEHSGEITIRPPEPLMTVVYKNGKGNRVEEEVTISSFGESGVVQKIRREIKTLQERLELIPSQFQEIPKRKHGGRLVPKSEQGQRRERLAKEMMSIPDRISHREEMIKQLKTILTSSDPLQPVQLEVNRAKIRILEGGLLLEEDQEFWRYVREKAPEIWQLFQNGQEQEYELIHGFFNRRFVLQRAKGLATEKEEKAREELHRFINTHLLVLSDKEYKGIEPIIEKVMEYFGERATSF